MLYVIGLAITPPTRRQFHLRNVQRFIAETKTIGIRSSPGRQRAAEPLGVIALRKVLTEMGATALCARQCALGDTQCQL